MSSQPTVVAQPVQWCMCCVGGGGICCGRQRKQKIKMKFIDLDHAGNDKLLNQLLLSLGRWLMLARRFCVHNAGLKVDAAREILTVIMTSNDKNVRLCKRHTVRTFCFWRSLGLATHYRES